MARLLSEIYQQWEQECNERYIRLKANEEELNRIFIRLYGLQNEVNPKAENITVRQADLQREIRSLISYAVGCLFGRYSPDEKGLCYAGGEWHPERYRTIIPEASNILPIGCPECFSHELTLQIMNFIQNIYGTETFEENLQFIADTLGGSGSPEEKIRQYLLYDFYYDHCRIYQKKPIYWMFRSGKKHAFMALVYLHRWDSDTIKNIILHVRRLQKYYQYQETLLSELLIYEEKLLPFCDITFNLDDGIKHNYQIFGDILQTIR